jgi:hypothetical protein
MSKSIKDFTKGNISASEFTAVLHDNEVEIDDKLALMIKREAAGDSQSYIAFGAHIFRKMNGSETYNRVDKINYNNLKIMGVEKVKNPFGFAEELATKNRKTLDLDKIEEEERNLGGVYIPRKGGKGAKNS